MFSHSVGYLFILVKVSLSGSFFNRQGTGLEKWSNWPGRILLGQNPDFLTPRSGLLECLHASCRLIPAGPTGSDSSETVPPWAVTGGRERGDITDTPPCPVSDTALGGKLSHSPWCSSSLKLESYCCGTLSHKQKLLCDNDYDLCSLFTHSYVLVTNWIQKDY